MVISTAIICPKFKTLSLMLPVESNINSYFFKTQLFQDHDHFSYIFHIFQDHNSQYTIF